MKYFPIFERLKTEGYGLYPGRNRDGNLDVCFAPGLTVVLGANGLGKSTLVNILFRMLTGAFDVNLPDGPIGTTLLKDQRLGAKWRSTFAARVNDAARGAKATFTYSIGPRRFVVVRSLENLDLLSFSVDGGIARFDEDELKNAVLSASGVSTFGEWIFILRTMIFFFEDRRQLVWDTSAQRQLLRCLLLDEAQASKWIAAERAILEQDSRMRNLNSALRREEEEQRKNENLTQAEPEVRERLSVAERECKSLEEKQAELIAQLEELDGQRHRARLDSLRADEDHHVAVQELERARLIAVESKFPSADASMRYIFSRLMTDDLCTICQTPGRIEQRERMLTAIDAKHCVLCDAVLPAANDAENLANERIEAMLKKVAESSITAGAAKATLDAAAGTFSQVNKELALCTVNLANARDEVSSLERRLPPDAQKRRKQADSLAEVKKLVTEIRTLIREKREEFANEMSQYRKTIGAFSEAIKAEFDRAANGFLLEDASLSWSPVRVQVGQAGAEGLEPIEYPAFAVEMTGANFSTGHRRDGPEQVSESQREFIDLAFRMALIKVVAPDHAATILIDAPESSLDAVFVNRAAAVLAQFANDNDMNRLVATSNLAAGTLIPAMLKAAEADPTKRAERIVDLFQLGVPTKAMIVMKAEYDVLHGRLLEEIAQGARDARPA